MTMDDEKLIEFVRNCPHLWDHSLQEYRDRSVCNRSWISIAEQLGGFTSKEARDRWRQLRDSFVRAKRNTIKKSGAGGEIKSKWKFSEKMNFLDKVLISRTSVSSLTISQDTK